MNTTNTPEIYTDIVSRVMQIADVTYGDAKTNYAVRFRGRLYGEDSEAAYDQLASALKPMGITPLFRWEGDQHAILLAPGLPAPQPSNPRTNLILFIITVLSVIFAGALYAYEGPATDDIVSFIGGVLSQLWKGIPFAISLLAILSAHEFGHYFAGRHHGTAVTLPYFIPFPFSPLGTLGAFINMKSPPKNKKVLLDIGIAGPLAGLIVSIPVLLIGLSLSKIEPVPAVLPAGQGLQIEGNSILYLLAKYVIYGQWLPAPASYGTLSPLLYWVRYFFTGQPLPLGGTDVMPHPVAWAGWAGILVTALNLIPAGQLDGGHMMYVLAGKNARKLLFIILPALALLGIAWPGWWLWVALILVFGNAHAEPLDQITPLDTNRQILAVLALVIFVLVFTPVPLLLVGG